MSHMRVLHVIGGGDTGGAMAYLLPFLRALRSEGCDARLLCLGGGGLADAAAERGLPCEVLPMGNAWDLSVVPGLRRSLAGGGWQVVHSHGMRANLPVRTTLALTRSRPAVFTTVHSDLALDYANPAKSGIYAVLDRMSARVVDGFCCVSSDLAGRLAARGIEESRIRVVHPGIDPADAPALGLIDRESAGGPGTVGTVARLVGVKDLGLLLEVADRLRDLSPGARVAIVGDGPERAALERRSEEAGLTGVVEFRGEVRPAWSALQELQVYVLTSISEGVPLSMLEAMWTGLPVVATAVGGIPEVIDNEVSGYLVSRNDDRSRVAAAIAERVSNLLAEPELRTRMGAAGRERIARAFTTTAAARTTLRFYERVLAERSEFGGW